jgi:hypothetical protein
VAALIWNLLLEHVLLEHNERLKHLLWALHFLRTYDTERAMACRLGSTEKTIEKWIHIVIEQICELDIVSIVFELSVHH